MPKEGIRIDILGTSFTIRTDEDPLYMNALLRRYQNLVEVIQKNTGLTDPLKSSIVAGLMLCDEIEKYQRKLNSASLQQNQETKQVEQLLMDLITRIETTLSQEQSESLFSQDHYETP
ncbi:MAG: cell division protein ZapA [Termitinemataceae bacterium]